MSSQRKIVILGTGGTIAGVSRDQAANVGYQAGQIAVKQLLAPILGQGVVGDVSYEVEQVAQLDSKDMDIATWQKLTAACQRWLQQEEVAGIVITHGTDTLEETAWFLQSVLQPSKPVVLTCAMRPATALSADGPANLRDALKAVAQMRAGGVFMVAAGEVHTAQWVHKGHPYRVHAFHSAEHGPAGWIEEGRLRWTPPACVAAVDEALFNAVLETPANAWPWIEVVCSAAASRPMMIDALLQAGVDGIVLAATGNGSIHAALLPALQRAQDQGVPVALTTRCEQGSIVLGAGEKAAGVSVLSAAKARISLMLELLQKRAASLV